MQLRGLYARLGGALVIRHHASLVKDIPLALTAPYYIALSLLGCQRQCSLFCLHTAHFIDFLNRCFLTISKEIVSSVKIITWFIDYDFCFRGNFCSRVINLLHLHLDILHLLLLMSCVLLLGTSRLRKL